MNDGDWCGPFCGSCGRCSDGPTPNATCLDCFEPFEKGPDDSDGFCDGCRARRDAWAEAMELRMAKAKALTADIKKEVA